MFLMELRDLKDSPALLSRLNLRFVTLVRQRYGVGLDYQLSRCATAMQAKTQDMARHLFGLTKRTDWACRTPMTSANNTGAFRWPPRE